MKILLLISIFALSSGSVIRLNGELRRWKRSDNVVANAKFTGNATASGEASNAGGDGTQTETNAGANAEVDLKAKGAGSGSSQAETGGAVKLDGTDLTKAEVESVATVEAVGDADAKTVSQSNNSLSLDWLLGRALALRNKGTSVGTGETTVISSFATRLSKTGKPDLKTDGQASAAATGSISSSSSGENNVTAEGDKQEAISLATAQGKGVETAKATGIATVNIEDENGKRGVFGNNAVKGEQTGTTGDSGVDAVAGGLAKSDDAGEAGAASGSGRVVNAEDGVAKLDNSGIASDGKKTITTDLKAISNGGVGRAELDSKSDAAIDQSGIIGNTRQAGRVVGTNQDLDITASVRSEDPDIGNTDGDALSLIRASGNQETVVNSTVNNNYIHPGRSEMDIFSLGEARANKGTATLAMDGTTQIDGPTDADVSSGVHNLVGSAGGDEAYVGADADLRAASGRTLVSLQGASATAEGANKAFANTAAKTLLSAIPDQSVDINAYGNADAKGDVTSVRSDTRVDSDGSGMDVAVNDQQSKANGAGTSSISIGGGSGFGKRRKRSVSIQQKNGKSRCFFSVAGADGTEHLLTLEDIKELYGFELTSVDEDGAGMKFQPMRQLDRVLIYAHEDAAKRIRVVHPDGL